MVVGWTLHACKHRTLRCQLEHCNPFRRPTVKFEERQKYRKQLMSVWLNSVSDDLDLITGKSEFVVLLCTTVFSQWRLGHSSTSFEHSLPLFDYLCKTQRLCKPHVLTFVAITSLSSSLTIKRAPFRLVVLPSNVQSIRYRFRWGYVFPGNICITSLCRNWNFKLF